MVRLAMSVLALAAFSGTAWAVEVPDSLPVRAPADTLAFRVSSPCDAPCSAPCEPPAGDCCSPCVRCPRWHAGLYGWLSWLDGETTVQGHTSDLHATPSELLDRLEGLFLGTIGVRWNRWNVEAVAFYSKLQHDLPHEADTNLGNGSKWTMTQWVAEGTVGYALTSWRAGSCPGSCMTLIAEAGVRYVSQELSLDFARGSLGKTVDWFDPIVGGRLEWDVNRKWSALFAANVGGFGVGSDFSAEIRLGVEYRLAKWVGIVTSFEALYWDYDDEIRMKQWTYGPTIGVEFHW